MRRFLSLCLFVITLTACSSNQRLEQALKFAGTNRSELEQVLEFYKYDKEKLAAARFLIENMPRYYSYRGEALDSVRRTLLKYKDEGFAHPEEKELWQGYDYNRLPRVYDAHVITAEYLINNIERAFRVWKERPWNKELCFDDFCELILPYRIWNEPLEDWRKTYEEKYAYLLDSVYVGSDVIAATDTVAHQLRKEGFVYTWDFNYPRLGASFLMDNRVGMCLDACDFALYVYRALGIPICIDSYVYSSETRKGHTWNAVRDTTGKFVGFWFTEQDAIRDSAYSDLRKAGKAFRETFGSRELALKPILSDKLVPSFFKALYRKDASADYYKDTLRLDASPEVYGRYAYLGVFNPHGWVGIDMAEVKEGKALFPHVEPRVIYAPMAFDGERYRVTDYPFYFDGKQNVPYVPDESQRDTLRLLRKNPLFHWQRDWLNGMAGGRLELLEAGGEVCLLYQLKDSLLASYNMVKLQKPIKARYLRFHARKDKVPIVAELAAYSRGERAVPKSIGGAEPENPVTRVRERACDGDPLTRYSSLEKGGSLVLDYGEAIRVDSIFFMPHNDDNFIRPGDEYELFYHGGSRGWISLGRKRATSPWLTYDNMPKGALFHLHCHTRGQEEQVFHIENGVQVFVSNQARPVVEEE